MVSDRKNIYSKKFGIDDTLWVFTKLFKSGITNFQDLFNTYTSLDEIKINWFAGRTKSQFQSAMQKNNLSFGMDLPS